MQVDPQPDPVSASVVVVTYNRPDHVRTCLEHVRAQTTRPVEVVVVDSSADDRTRDVVTADFPEVHYVRNPLGRGSTATARNLGLGAVSADVVAFLDDDAFADPEWLARLLVPYGDARVGAVGGRARNGIPGEEHEGVDRIGRLEPDGTLTGHFAADPGRPVDVDHLLGANMSFRRSVLDDLGGIRDGYPGTCLREETDLCLRVRSAGWRLVYTPSAVVDHVAGPYARGRRFDVRYTYFAQRNHVLLLARNLGVRSPQARRYLGIVGSEVRSQLGGVPKAVAGLRPSDPVATARPLGGRLARSGAMVAGAAVGLAVALGERRRVPGSGPRREAAGR